MPVELTFNAPDVAALHEQVLAYARNLHAPDLTSPGIGRPSPDDAKYRSPLVEPPVNSGETPKPRRKHRKTKDVAKSETKLPVNSDDTPEEPQPEPLAEPQGEEPSDVDIVQNTPDDIDLPNVANDPVAAEKLKAEVIAQMQDWFAAGKVKMIRSVLDQYGGGAKSFPEIDASRFPAIDKAIKSGAIA